jgi:hypothetical protein
MSMLFLLKFSLIEFDLSLASSETRRNEFRNVSRSSVTRSFASDGITDDSLDNYLRLISETSSVLFRSNAIWPLPRSPSLRRRR